MEKNEVYEGLVEDVGAGGEGIVKIEGTTVFVPFCLAGERVVFKILKVKDNIAYGKLLSVLRTELFLHAPCFISAAVAIYSI